MNRVCILGDGTSSVGGFETDGNKFFKEMSREGVTITNTKEVFKLFLDTDEVEA